MQTEARWHIGMPSASYWDPLRVPGSNPGKGEYLYTNLNKNELSALIHC